MPESRHEKLKSRLFHYARSLGRIQAPSLPADLPRTTATQTDQSEGVEEDESPSADQQLLTLNHFRREWKKLRSYVLGGEEKETTMVGPEDVNVEALRYLESIIDTLNRRNDELEKKRDEVLKQRNAWTAAVEGTEGDSDTQEGDRQKLFELNVRLSELEHKLSFVGFRHSMAEAMLTQIALLDTIQTWDDFHPRDRDRNNDGLNKHEKRAIIIGHILERIRNEEDYKFNKFNSYKDFFNRFNIHELPMHKDYGAIRYSLETKLGLWEKGTEGESASHLPKIRSNCVQFSRKYNWRPDNIDEMYEELLESLAERL